MAEERIEVVSGAIVRNGRILFTQRTGDREFPWHWELPGGKVEEGETHAHALGREIQEELGLIVMPAYEPFWVGRFDPPVTRKPVRVSIYLASIVGPATPALREVAGAAWFELPLPEGLLRVPSLYQALPHLQSLNILDKII